MITANWPELEKKYLMFNIKRPQPVMVHDEGVRLWDDAGREYLDFMAWRVIRLRTWLIRIATAQQANLFD